MPRRTASAPDNRAYLMKPGINNAQIFVRLKLLEGAAAGRRRWSPTVPAATCPRFRARG